MIFDSELVTSLQAELQQAVEADISLPAIIATVRAPSLGLDWSGAATRTGLGSQSPDMAFRIASVTKVFTAATILRLVEQRRLGLFDLAGPLLSAESAAVLASNGHPLSVITIYHLMTHTAGLHDHAGPDSPYAALCAADPARVWAPMDQILIGMAMGPPIAAPGAHFSYSDSGYVLLGEIIERVTGQALGMSVRQLVGFERLGMTQTWWEGEATAPSGQRRAVQWMGDLDVAAIHPSSDQFGGGGLVSTTGDLVTFMRALLRGAVFEHPATLAASLMTPAVTFTPPALLHSALLRGTVIADRQCLGHKGFWGVQVADLPDLDLTLAVSWGQVECGPATMGTDGRLIVADRIVALLAQKMGL